MKQQQYCNRSYHVSCRVFMRLFLRRFSSYTFSLPSSQSPFRICNAFFFFFVTFAILGLAILPDQDVTDERTFFSVFFFSVSFSAFKWVCPAFCFCAFLYPPNNKPAITNLLRAFLHLLLYAVLIFALFHAAASRARLRRKLNR